MITMGSLCRALIITFQSIRFADKTFQEFSSTTSGVEVGESEWAPFRIQNEGIEG